MLKVNDLVVSYGGIEALKGISLEVPDGKMPVMRIDREAARLYWALVDAPPEPETEAPAEPPAPTHAEIEAARAAGTL